ncbi:MAG TPA: S41 family peptidase [Mucilaginibacter sp.]|nr:S41 family peptidase [Mucilaginibacter sp.]
MRRLLLLQTLMLSILVAGAQTLTREQARADIKEFNQVLKEVHYNPFLYITPDAYSQKVDSMERSLSDSIGAGPFLLKLSQLTAALNDGHTMPAIIQPIFKDDFRKKIYFPLSLTVHPDGSLFTSTSSGSGEIPPGAKIVSVNGINMARFYVQAKGYLGGLSAFRNTMSLALMSNYLYEAGLRPPFNVSYTANGKLHNVVLPEGVILKQTLVKAFPQLAGTDYQFKIVNNKIGYINLITMGNDYKKYQAFFDSCFTTIKAAHLGAVVIDLRQNSGGNAIIAHLLISYFNTKPYALSGGRYWKVSNRYKSYLLSRGDTSNLYLKHPDNTIIDQRNCGPRAPMFVDNNLLFAGKVYLITGPATFSSAMQLADAVKQYHLATVIGQPTGENTNDFGEIYSFALTNSKLQIQVTTTFDIGADCDIKKNHPVVPDKIIKSMDSSERENDAIFKYIIKELKGR